MKRLIHSVAALALAWSALAQEAPTQQVQTTPPAPSAPREAKIPQPVEKTLANGLRVIVVSKHDVPLVAAQLMIRTGGEADPRGREGLASMTADVLTSGTKTKTSEQIARGIEALGATLTSSAAWDSSNLELSVMSSNFAKAMEFAGDVARNATFPKDEFDRKRAQSVDAVQVAMQEPRLLAAYAGARVLFGDAPYGHVLSGTPASLETITREELVKFHREYYRPENAVLIIGGDVKPEAAFEIAQKSFGSWTRGEGKAAATITTKNADAKASASRVVVIDMPDAGQAAVSIVRPGIRRSDPQLFRALVANSVLGGGYSARLSQEIRIKRGLSYGAGSSFEPRRDAGPFTARTETKNETADEVVDVIVAEMKRLSASDVSDAELTPRKAVLIGGFANSLATSEGVVDRLAVLALHGLPLSDINKYIGSVQAVTADDVRKFAASNMSGDSSVVIVGDAKQFLEPLRAMFKNVEVIPIADLDLSSATLRAPRKTE